MQHTLNIGLIAYNIDHAHVFVRVPNERARWLLTDRCVVEVDCQYCRTIKGEPCRSKAGYTAGTHFIRRGDWTKAKREQGLHLNAPAPKLRLTPDDLNATQREPEEA